MKNKIRIMQSKPEISDQELNRLMNFDKVLADSKKMLAAHQARVFKYSAFTVGSVVLVATLFVLVQKDQPVEQPVPTQETAPVQPSTDNTTQESEALPAETADEDVKASENERPKQKKQVIVDSPAGDENQSKPATPALQEPVEDTQKTIKTPTFEQAAPVEGYPHLYEYFAKELQYPHEALLDSIQGVVTVIFTIDTNGKAKDISIEKSLGEPVDREVRRVIQNMPLWKPATFNGNAVDSKISLPLTFQIEEIKD